MKKLIITLIMCLLVTSPHGCNRKYVKEQIAKKVIEHFEKNHS